jgi:hypothetical protein
MRSGITSGTASNARLSTFEKAATYSAKAIRRLESGTVTTEEGSWLEGIFGKAAKRYEQWAREMLADVLCCCAIDYHSRLRSSVKGSPAFSKLTLGQIAFCFKIVWQIADHAKIQSCFNGKAKYTKFYERMFEVNDLWVECVKHGYKNLTAKAALEQLRSIQAALEDATIQR